MACARDHLRRPGTGSHSADVGHRLGAVRDQPRARPAVHALPQSTDRHRHPVEHTNCARGDAALAGDGALRHDGHLRPRHHAEPCARIVLRISGDPSLGPRRRCRTRGGRAALRVLAVHDRAAPRSLQPGAVGCDAATCTHAGRRDPRTPATPAAHARTARCTPRGRPVLHRAGVPAHRVDRRADPCGGARAIASRRRPRASRVHCARRSLGDRSGSRAARVSDMAAAVRRRPRRDAGRASTAPISTSRIRPTSSCRPSRS